MKGKKENFGTLSEADEAREKKGLTRLTGTMTISEQCKILEEYNKVMRTCTIAEFIGRLIMLGLKAHMHDRRKQQIVS